MEFLGKSILYSINYERVMHNKSNNWISLRIGYTYDLTFNTASFQAINYGGVLSKGGLKNRFQIGYGLFYFTK